jgi:predicted RNase H-like nuclease (RuvC/YqgF family)
VSIDIDDLASEIATGIYGDDRMSVSDLNAALSALAALVSEVERLRGEVERDHAAVVAWLRAGTAECREVLSERERADSLSLAYREQQGENDELRAELKATQREREHWHDAWVTAVEHRWGRGASVCAVAYNMAETIERGEHRREEDK